MIRTRLENRLAMKAIEIINEEERYQRLITRVAPSCDLLELLPERTSGKDVSHLTESETVILAVLFYAGGGGSKADSICPNFFSTIWTMSHEPIFQLLKI